MYLHPRLLSLALDVRWRIVLSALVGMLAAAAGVARLAVAALIIADVVRGEASFESLGWPLAGMAGLIAARAVLQYWQEVMSHHTASIVKVKLRERLYRHSLALGPGHFDASRTGDALMSLAEGVERLEAFFGRYLPQMIVAAAAPLVIFAVMALIDLRTGLIFLVFALFTLIIPNLFHRWTRERSMARRDAYGALGADFLDTVQGLATLKAFGQSGARGELLAERARRLFRATMGVLAANAATGALTILGITGGAAVALGWGAARVADGELELRALLIVLMLGVEIFRPLRELVQLYHDGMIAMSSAEGIFAIMDSPVAVADPALRQAQGDRDGRQGNRDVVVDGRDVVASGRGATDSGRDVMASGRDVTASGRGATDSGRDGMRAEVVFEGVGYAYNRGRRPALRGLSFTLGEGETLGLVGPSGAGKSTVVWLMLRFFDPQEGAIRLGGRDLRDIPLEELRRQISVVTQDTYLFHGTVAENLRFGNPGASQDELAAAARAANAHDFIGHLPDGYETVVGERAVRLSGGQKQRIAIARALLKDAPILVLDEALSSVDAENEAVIQEALERLMTGRTTLIIAHRLSSVVNADRILALDDGRLAESGSHSELAAAGGLYATLMAQQQERGDFDVHFVGEHRAVAEPRAAAHPAAPVDVGAFMPRTAHSGEGHHHHAAPQGSRGDGDHHGHRDHHGQDGGHHGGHGRGSASGDGGESGGRHVEADAFIPRPAHGGGGHHHHHAGHHHAAAHRDGVGDGRRLGVIAVWGRLLGLVMPWRGELVLTFLLGVAHHSAVIGVGVVSALLVGQVITGGDLTLLLILLGALTPLAAFFIWTESWAAHDLAYRLLAEMRVDLYRKLDPLAPAYMTRRRSGDLVSVVGGDVETVEFFFAHTVTPAFTAVVVPGAVVAVLAVIAWPMAAAVAPFLAAVALSPFFAQRRSERLGEELRRQLGEVHAHMVDSIQGMREISAFGRGAARTAEMVDNSWRFADYQLRFLKERAFQVGFIESMTALGGLVVLTVGVWLLTNGNISRPELILAVVLSVAAFAPVSDIARTMKQLMETLAAARRLFAIHDAPVTVADGPGATGAGRDDDGAASEPAVAPSLEFHGVGFAYGAGEAEALREVSFTVAPGDTVALVGRSGAGKTTCANLVMRFWDPTAGAVRLDGRDLRDFKLDDLRGQVALVSQDTYLFNASVRDNIRLGRAGASDAELAAAARQANCHDFITAFPDGYDTVVGERGMQLSGGQRQRIAIARALLKNAPMLILDEATSHLDAVSESQLRQALEHLMRGRTTMVIAHRLSTIRDADRIVVLDYGRAVEQGSHQELLERGGLYARLVATQLVSAGDGGDARHSGGDGGRDIGGDRAGGWAGVPGGTHQHRHHHHH